MINDNIVDISISMGTGLSIHQYYCISDDEFSPEYSYVLATSDELIAYLDVDNEDSFENRKVLTPRR